MANFTSQAIKSTFMKLLNEKPLGKISVKEIVEECGINRNTFYYHFDDIPALLTEIITEQTDAIIRQYPQISSLELCFEAVIDLARNNRQAVLHIFASADQYLFTVLTMRHCERVVISYLDTAFADVPILEPDRKALIRVLKCQLYGFCIDWVTGGMQEEALEDLRRLIGLSQGMPEWIIDRIHARGKDAT